jgi:hypothetical protein
MSYTPGINEWRLDTTASQLRAVSGGSPQWGGVTKKGEGSLVAKAFIVGGERGSWQQAYMSASTADIEAVRQQ